MNKIVNQFLSSGNNFIPKLHFKQTGFTYIVCTQFTKHRERVQKFRKIGNLKHWYRNNLHKAGFTHNAAYSDRKGLAKKTVSDKILKDRTYEIARNLKYDKNQRALASIVYRFCDKKQDEERNLV